MPWVLRKKPSPYAVKPIPRIRPVRPVQPIKPIKPVRPVKPVAPVGYTYVWKD